MPAVCRSSGPGLQDTAKGLDYRPPGVVSGPRRRHFLVAEEQYRPRMVVVGLMKHLDRPPQAVPRQICGTILDGVRPGRVHNSSGINENARLSLECAVSHREGAGKAGIDPGSPILPYPFL